MKRYIKNIIFALALTAALCVSVFADVGMRAFIDDDFDIIEISCAEDNGMIYLSFDDIVDITGAELDPADSVWIDGRAFISAAQAAEHTGYKVFTDASSDITVLTSPSRLDGEIHIIGGIEWKNGEPVITAAEDTAAELSPSASEPEAAAPPVIPVLITVFALVVFAGIFALVIRKNRNFGYHGDGGPVLSDYEIEHGPFEESENAGEPGLADEDVDEKEEKQN